MAFPLVLPVPGASRRLDGWNRESSIPPPVLARLRGFEGPKCVSACKSRQAFQRSALQALHWVASCRAVILGGGCSGNFSLSFSKQQPLIRLRLRVARQDDFPSVGGRQDARRSFALPPISPGPSGASVPGPRSRKRRRQGHVQAVGQKRHEDVRFDPLLLLVMKRAAGPSPLFRCLKASSTCVS